MYYKKKLVETTQIELNKLNFGVTYGELITLIFGLVSSLIPHPLWIYFLKTNPRRTQHQSGSQTKHFTPRKSKI